MTQLELKPMESLRAAIARECRRIVAIAALQAADLRAAGKHKRAEELLADRERLVASITRGSEHAVRRRRR